MMAGAKVQQQQKSLNPKAPEFLPKRNVNPSFHDYYNSPSPLLQTYTALFFPGSVYTSPYSTQPVLHPYGVLPSTATMAPLTEPAAPLMLEPVEVTVQNDNQRAGRRAEYRNRVLCHRRGFKGRDGNQAYSKKQEWGRKFYDNNNGEYPHLRYQQDFSRFPRNSHCRAAPPQRKHPILPVRKDGENTTVMIRNIPNRFTREMLVDFLDDHCMMENQKAEVQDSAGAAVKDEAVVSAFDFVYLPIDFRNRVNKGYAFVNFTDTRAVWKFYLACHNRRWEAFQSNKIREIAYARLQGKEELVRYFKNVEFPCDRVEGKQEYLPVCFSPPRNGSKEKANPRTVGRCRGTGILESPHV